MDPNLSNSSPLKQAGFGDESHVPERSFSISPSSPSGDPFNPGSGSTHSKLRRNYRACLNCRVRKVKCDLGPVDNPREGKCARCLRERKDCVFVESKRGGTANVVSGRKRRKRSESSENDADNTSLISGNTAVLARTISGSSERNYALSEQSSRSSSNNSYNQRGPALNEEYNNQMSKLPSVNSILNSSSSGTNLPQPQHNVNESSEIPQPETAENQNNDNKNNGPSNHFSTMEGALVFLAKAAGTIAKADERDNIDGRTKQEQIESRISHSNSQSQTPTEIMDRNQASSMPGSRSDAGSNVASTLKGRTSSSVEQPSVGSETGKTSSTVPEYIKPTTEAGKRMTMPAAENGYSVRPRASNKLSNIEYIGGPNGILTEDEAEMLIHLFFTVMHPYFPHLPKFLHSSKVLSGYPILLCAILTIASRYHSFENNVGTTGGVPRNIEVHDRLWLYVQRLISQTVWAEASTRSIGTIFAFLLFTEWNPRAIHWRWSDYANKAEENNDTDSGLGFSAETSGANSAGKNDEPNMAGLGAMRRSYRMAWMLIGSSVRLAQDMGFMEISPKTFIATHVAEINSVMNISRSSMLAHSLAEVDLDEDEVTEEDMEQDEDDDDKIMKMSEEDLKRLSSEHVLKFTLSQKAQIELLQIISLGHESLYGYKAQLGNMNQRQNLSILNIISPMINNWGRKYKQFLVASNKLLRITNIQQHWYNPSSKIAKEISEAIERESLIFEFNYVKLYIYSLALSPSPRAKYEQRKNRKGKATLKLDEISKSAKYIEQAFKSANEMLSVAHRVHKLKMLRFMPVRWLTRMVRAVAFIVKCYLTITAHKNSANGGNSSIANSADNFDSTILSLSLISIEDIIQSIQRAAITLRDCSPDELHLCTRYSNVLMYLCSEMKAKSKGFHDEEQEQDYSSYGYSKERSEYEPPENSVSRTSIGPPLAMYAFDSNYDQNVQFVKPKNSNEQRIQIQVQLQQKQQQQQQQQDQQHQQQDQQHQQQDQQQQQHQQHQYSIQQPVESQLNRVRNATASFDYPPSDYLGNQRSNSNSNMSNSESMPPNDSNTPLQSLVGDSEVMDFFMKNRNIGLDFVGPWTEMIEQSMNLNDQFSFEDAL